MTKLASVRPVSGRFWISPICSPPGFVRWCAATSLMVRAWRPMWQLLGTVTVVEADPLRAAQAHMAGHCGEGFATALPSAEAVFATEKDPHLGIEQVIHLTSGILMCAAGATAVFSPEIVAFGSELRPVRAQLEELDLPHARALKLTSKAVRCTWQTGRGCSWTSAISFWHCIFQAPLNLCVCAWPCLISRPRTLPLKPPWPPLKSWLWAGIWTAGTGF